MSKESEVTEYEQKRMQSKKVLGFKEKDSWNVIAVNNDKIFAVNSNKLVPVRLASESVDKKEYDELEERYCTLLCLYEDLINRFNFCKPTMKRIVKDINDFVEAAEKEAKE